MNFAKYTIKKTNEVLKGLRTSEQGLSTGEAEKRLEKYGFNEIKSKETTLFHVLLRQFKSPFFYLLFIASIIAFAMGEAISAIAILFFVAINVVLGFFQEARAEKTIAALKKYLPSNTRVMRDNKEKMIDKKFLVPGDIVLIESGNVVPVDLRILRTEDFMVDESILTGESVPVSKISKPLSSETNEIFEAANVLFAGTSVVSGKAEGVVIGVAKNTALGEIAKLVSEISRESAYEKDLLKLSKSIMRAVLITIIAIFLLNLLIKGKAMVFDFLIFSIALIVSIIPEALPLVVISALSSGALKLAKEKVVVKRLSALEDLGNIEILCTDKTGTLTEGRMKLEGIFSEDHDKCLLFGLLSSAYVDENVESSLNPFDTVLYDELDGRARYVLRSYKSIDEIPFDSFRMRNSMLLKTPEGNKVLIVKGAAEHILERCSSTEGAKSKEQFKTEMETEGEKGRRVLAIAYKNFEGEKFTEQDERDLTFLGYYSFKDPLKKTAEEAIILARKLGTKIKILTGDSPEVAGAVAKEIGLIKNPKEVILGEKIDSLSRNELANVVEKYSVFARVSPTTKYNIIKKLQEKHEVGFLGEGINDTPSLKLAHLAIVVDSAADVSREVADIVLLRRDLKVIVDGIKEGRNIFSNINKYIKCTLASNFGNSYSLAIISLFINYLPLLPIQILLVNFLSDFPLIAVASDKVDVEELRKPKLYQLNKVFLLIILLAFISTVFDFLFFYIFHKVPPDDLRTMWYIESIVTEILLIFSIRSRHFFARAKAPSVILLLTSVITIGITLFLPFTDFGHKVFHFINPSANYLLIVAGLLIGYIILSEVVKLIYFRYKKI